MHDGAKATVGLHRKIPKILCVCLCECVCVDSLSMCVHILMILSFTEISKVKAYPLINTDTYISIVKIKLVHWIVDTKTFFIQNHSKVQKKTA